MQQPDFIKSAFKTQHQQVYGSSREAVLNRDLVLNTATVPVTEFKHKLGNKQFQVDNHLGNVLSTYSDHAKKDNGGSGSTILGQKAIILSVSTYSSFGAPLEDASTNWSNENYRYGFNGMEKDDEVKGDGNSYTTEFRQNDSRLGRWLSIDPFFKHFQSSYVTFRNNPSIFIDPLGADDFFDINGNYLGSTPEGSTIRVVNEGVTFDAAAKDIENSTKMLSQFTYCDDNDIENNMLTNIATYYGNKVGIDSVGIVRVKISTDGGPAAATTKQLHIGITVDDYGNINSTIDNFWNLTNTLVHEIDHQKKWSERTAPIDHVEANLTQANHESWKMTTQEYKSSTLSYSAYLLNQALIQGEPLENVIKKMDKVNNSPIGNNGFLFYNSETNQIEAIHLISTFEVTPEKE